MSDDSFDQQGGYPLIVRAPTAIEEHYCEHPGCKRWGSFGHPAGRKTEWFCREHRPIDVPLATNK